MTVGAQAEFSSRTRFGTWVLLVSTVALLVVIQAFGTLEHLRLEAATAGLDIWRLVTGHLIHVSWSHLVLNVVAVLLLWMLVGDAFGALGWIAVTIVCMAAVNIGLMMFSPEVAWYAGLSGLLHGLAVAGALVNWHRLGYISTALLLGILAKLFLEQYGGSSPALEQLIGAQVISDAHLYGALGGLLCGSVVLWKRHATDFSRYREQRRRSPVVCD
jgi:rhomboid family GlyGly-CTERM serine protease